MIIFVEYIANSGSFAVFIIMLAEKITKLKKLKKISQVELANITGISRDAISKYERGDVLPSVEYAKRIADALGVSLDYLVSDEETEELLNTEAVKRIRAIQKLPENEQDKLLSVLDAYIRDFNAKQAYAS